MKRETKLFKKPANAQLHDIAALVSAKLRKKFLFNFSDECQIIEGPWIRAACRPPAKLVGAWVLREPITFSITLPSHYWKTT